MSDFVNAVALPDTLQGVVDIYGHDGVSCSTTVSYPSCSAIFQGYSLIGSIHNLRAYYCGTRSSGSHFQLVADFSIDLSVPSSLSLISIASVGGSPSSCSYLPGYFGEGDNLLFYSVKPSSDLLMPAVILAVAFFTLIYKMFKRVLF